jgi:Plasmid encoded RepA protein
MNRLFRASISFEQSLERPDGAEGSRWLDMRVAPKGELWWDPKMPDQGALWGSWVQLSQEFFEAITAAPVPLDMRALRALKRSPLALDLYTWATYRTFSVRKAGKAVTVPYGALQAQLGTNYERERDFKTALKDALGKVQRVYPALKCEMEEGGLTILPGLTAVRTKAKAIKPTDEPPKALPIDRHSLKPETYQKAREAAPGYDVRYLEELWREWVSSKGIQITHPDGHFLRFCKTQKKLKPNP